ncbi:LytTR family transcriptional regulator DNA-binding domain-containing protein [Paenibacillus chibensis]|uniref:LytTR family transcriptional regulator DNA-binding domain-containing protein n=1 Tax=Paenibacillus chibensis TaxID=59846 RepID=UPI000FDC1F70|nr:LytTR family transcriptional regulator DNA-binding domain-containing protein [Paenibacillus chibensis]MEC0369826.1 LytTR family transcriptional regulator DNA-binding domain-containing protein [Paenibacillus chibensis]
MNQTDKVMNEYQNFDPVTDAFFFKTGSQEQVIFHGRNYIIKKRLSAAEQATMKSLPNFVRAASNLYVNVNKITNIDGNTLHFRDEFAYPRTITVSKRTLEQIKRLLPRTPGFFSPEQLI